MSKQQQGSQGMPRRTTFDKALEKVTVALAADGFRAPRKTVAPDTHSERNAGLRLYLLFEVENATGEHRALVAQLQHPPAPGCHVAVRDRSKTSPCAARFKMMHLDNARTGLPPVASIEKEEER